MSEQTPNDQPQSPYGGQPGGPANSSQPPYGQPPQGQNPYGQPTYSSGDHPQATMILILGIVSLVLCSIAGPFAWVMGNRALAEIDASGGRIGGRGQVQAGRICGMIASILMILGIVLLIVLVVFGGIMAGTSTT